MGTERSKGTKTFAIAGDVHNTGLIEVPMGITLREIVYDVGGGIKDDKAFKAIQTGGPMGGCLPEEYLDLPDRLRIADLRRLDDGLGRSDRHGRRHLHGGYRPLLHGIHPGRKLRQMHPLPGRHPPHPGDPGAHLRRRRPSRAISRSWKPCATKSSKTACAVWARARPTRCSARLKHFRDEYEAHIYEKRCPAKVCRSLIRYEIVAETCTGCTVCARNCPVDAISGERRQPHVIDPDICIRCGICMQVCNFNAITVLS